MAKSRRCRQCWRPLRATARADARYCGVACRAKARRGRLYWKKAVAVGIAAARGLQDEIGRHCPVCGAWFVPGVDVRRDTVYDRPRCRTAAWRARQRAA
ncbi:hypothetical protein ACFQVD_08860 [Streptosporangium amethystogenes subsp. fukuiense]|uniref:DUF2256 domain-containing protein n=1 Tax=Streptosporangium amethystogenes subsp. fukuiense TaxID=698418 RepID=A0ABW2SVB0_9ACTN